MPGALPIVGAVYDRAFFLTSAKYARSQTAPTAKTEQNPFRWAKPQVGEGDVPPFLSAIVIR